MGRTRRTNWDFSRLEGAGIAGEKWMTYDQADLTEEGAGNVANSRPPQWPGPNGDGDQSDTEAGSGLAASLGSVITRIIIPDQSLVAGELHLRENDDFQGAGPDGQPRWVLSMPATLVSPGGPPYVYTIPAAGLRSFSPNGNWAIRWRRIGGLASQANPTIIVCYRDHTSRPGAQYGTNSSDVTGQYDEGAHWMTPANPPGSGASRMPVDSGRDELHGGATGTLGLNATRSARVCVLEALMLDTVPADNGNLECWSVDSAGNQVALLMSLRVATTKLPTSIYRFGSRGVLLTSGFSWKWVGDLGGAGPTFSCTYRVLDPELVL